MRGLFASLVAALLVCTPAGAEDVPTDPLRSGMWASMAAQYFGGGRIVFDPRVVVLVPDAAEDQFQVPVTVDASALDDVVEIVVVADLNPIQKAMAFRPGDAEPFVGLRLKVEQTTPIRAGVRTADGTWHIGGAIVEAAGGGCTAPAAAHGQANWMTRLGEAHGALVDTPDGISRVMVKLRHPMDTGLADGIPVFHLDRLSLVSAAGAQLAEMDVYEPVSENPSFAFRARLGGKGVNVSGRDTEGNEYAFAIAAPAAGN